MTSRPPSTIDPVTGKKDPTYVSWSRMKQRVRRGYCKLDDPYWNSFAAFYEDMGDRPVGTTLNRRDNNKGYSKANCNWATDEEQQNNRTNNVMLTFEGTTQTAAQWAKMLGISKTAMYLRIQKLGKNHRGLFSTKAPGKTFPLDNR